MDCERVTGCALLTIRGYYSDVAELSRDPDQDVEPGSVDAVIVGAEDARPPVPRLGAVTGTP